MFHFGFSYVGLIYLLMLLIPNLIWTRHQPKDYAQSVQTETRFLRVLERIGEVLVCCCVLIFSDFNVRWNSIWCIWLLLSFVLMLLYEAYWIRYFRSEKRMSDFYRSFCGVPVAGAALPVCAFFLLGVYGSNIFLILSTVLMGIGHIGIHLEHRKEVCGSVGKPKIAIRVAKWAGAVVLAVVFGLISVVIGFRNVRYASLRIDTGTGVDEEIYVALGGQEQFLQIRGRDVQNPVLIWLHGGPSGPDSFVNYTFQKYLTDEYTVVNWDQRGCGRTYYRNRDKDPQNQTASFEQAQVDLNELVDYVCGRFHTEKVILVGHSYGTMLGSRYALEHPDKVFAYIGVGQVVSIESDLYSYQDALEKAAAIGDDTSAMELAYQKYIDDRTLANMMELRAHVSKYHAAPREANTIWYGLTSPFMGMNDFRWFLKQMGDLDDYIALNRQLFDHIMIADVRDDGLEYQVPVGFISGSEDWVTPVRYAEDYCRLITAPEKEFALIEGCGHSPQYDAPKEFCDALKQMLEEYLKDI